VSGAGTPFPSRCLLCMTRADMIGASEPTDTYADERELEAHVNDFHPPANIVMLLSWLIVKLESAA
jgi:hypothetical protein